MIKDTDLRSSTDYSKGMVDATYSVLGEIVNLLEHFADDIRIVGGWVPSLLFLDNDHIGSIDVDVLYIFRIHTISINKLFFATHFFNSCHCKRIFYVIK